jgi:hypothetical protein
MGVILGIVKKEHIRSTTLSVINRLDVKTEQITQHEVILSYN